MQPIWDAVIVPIGGGGLMAGVAWAIKQLQPNLPRHRRGTGGVQRSCTGASSRASRRRSMR